MFFRCETLLSLLPNNNKRDISSAPAFLEKTQINEEKSNYKWWERKKRKVPEIRFKLKEKVLNN